MESAVVLNTQAKEVYGRLQCGIYDAIFTPDGIVLMFGCPVTVQARSDDGSKTLQLAFILE